MASHARNGGIFNNQLTVNLSGNPVKNCEIRLRFDRMMGTSLRPHFFGPLCIYGVARVTHNSLATCTVTELGRYGNTRRQCHQWRSYGSQRPGAETVKYIPEFTKFLGMGRMVPESNVGSNG